jgi:solute carrier family 25 citrate transporter 1
VESLAYGGLAGIISVYATMPFDVVKTRMQGLEAKQYTSSFDCARKILADEGVLAYWKGTVPRLSRVMFSSGIIFTFYEMVSHYPSHYPSLICLYATITDFHLCVVSIDHA